MSTADSRTTLLGALREALGFEAHGEAVANLTLGKGSLDGRPVRVALIENRIASGSIGKAEVAKLAPLLGIVARERSPLVLYLDSAGARISEGLDALGAFRRLFREALAARVSGAPIAIALGRNCYGGASMLAHVAGRRLFSPETQLAMSGPAILAQAAGTTVLDEMFRAIAEAAIGAAARAKASDANTVWSPEVDLAAWLRSALVDDAQPWTGLLARHEALRARLGKGPATRQPETVRRKDLERLYRDGYQAAECDGIITGECNRPGWAGTHPRTRRQRATSGRSGPGDLRTPRGNMPGARRRDWKCCWIARRTRRSSTTRESCSANTSWTWGWRWPPSPRAARMSR